MGIMPGVPIKTLGNISRSVKQVEPVIRRPGVDTIRYVNQSTTHRPKPTVLRNPMVNRFKLNSATGGGRRPQISLPPFRPAPSKQPLAPSNNLDLIKRVGSTHGFPSFKFNNQQELITFRFSVPRPRLTAGGFKTAKPRLLRQVNTAKLKRPGILRPKTPGIGVAPL